MGYLARVGVGVGDYLQDASDLTVETLVFLFNFAERGRSGSLLCVS